MVPLSEWPEHFRDGNSDSEMVTVEFVEEMCVLAETDKAIGIAAVDSDGDVEYWLPKSQLTENYTQDDVLDEIELPLWLAEEKGLA